MTNFPQEDRNLIKFLQDNCPLPPSANPQLESQLMELIKRQPHKRSKQIPLILAIPGIVTAGTLLLSIGNRVFNPQPQLAIDSAILETFLVNTWKDTLEDTNLAASEEERAYLLLSTMQQSQFVSSFQP